MVLINQLQDTAQNGHKVILAISGSIPTLVLLLHALFLFLKYTFVL